MMTIKAPSQRRCRKPDRQPQEAQYLIPPFLIPVVRLGAEKSSNLDVVSKVVGVPLLSPLHPPLPAPFVSWLEIRTIVLQIVQKCGLPSRCGASCPGAPLAWTAGCVSADRLVSDSGDAFFCSRIESTVSLTAYTGRRRLSSARIPHADSPAALPRGARRPLVEVLPVARSSEDITG